MPSLIVNTPSGASPSLVNTPSGAPVRIVSIPMRSKANDKQDFEHSEAYIYNTDKNKELEKHKKIDKDTLRTGQGDVENFIAVDNTLRKSRIDSLMAVNIAENYSYEEPMADDEIAAKTRTESDRLTINEVLKTPN